MNFKDEYKKENDKLTLDSEFVSKLSMKMRSCTNIKKHMARKSWISVSTAMVFVIVGVFIIWESNMHKEGYIKKEDGICNKKIDDVKSQGVIVPKLQIANSTEENLACRIETLVYNNKVYVLSGSKLSVNDGKKIMDNNISNNVYRVKGYDDFRLITYYNHDGEEEVKLWECLNGFTMHSGKDVFGKMNLQGNVSKMQWDTYDNWDKETLELKLVGDNGEVENFISALYDAKPISLEENDLSNKLFHHEDNANENQKFIYLTMKDGVMVELRLFKEGYVLYSGLNGFVFKVDKSDFYDLWNVLK